MVVLLTCTCFAEFPVATTFSIDAVVRQRGEGWSVLVDLRVSKKRTPSLYSEEETLQCCIGLMESGWLQLLAGNQMEHCRNWDLLADQT